MLAAEGGHTETVQALVNADIYTKKASVKVHYSSVNYYHKSIYKISDCHL